MRTLIGLMFLLVLSGCAAKPPKLEGFKAHDFPVYAPSTVKSSMGASTGEAVGDPNSSQHLTYWLKSESKPEAIVAWYRDKMKSLPGAQEVQGESKFEGALLQFTCPPPSQPETVAEYAVIVEKDLEDGQAIFRVTETLKPGLKY